MKYVKQFLIILSISFVGEILKGIIPLPIPASIYGLVLMLLALCFKILKVEDVSDTGDFLIEIMPMMFIPPAVGIIVSWKLIKPIWFPICFITIITTILVMAVSGRVTQRIIRTNRQHHEKEAKK